MIRRLWHRLRRRLTGAAPGVADELAHCRALAIAAVQENRRLRALWRHHHPDVDVDIALLMAGPAVQT